MPIINTLQKVHLTLITNRAIQIIELNSDDKTNDSEMMIENARERVLEFSEQISTTSYSELKQTSAIKHEIKLISGNSTKC